MKTTVRTIVAVVLVATAVVFRPSSVDAQGPPSVEQRLAALEAKVAALQSQVTALQAAKATVQAQINAEVTARSAADTALQTQIANIPTVPQNLLDLANYVSVDLTTINELAGPHVLFSGANVHIRNSPWDGVSPIPLLNGVGNLIVGFNWTEGGQFRQGSHNIVVGDLHNYNSYNGLVAGVHNSVQAPHASVTGGVNNLAIGRQSSVCGGSDNQARGRPPRLAAAPRTAQTTFSRRSAAAYRIPHTEEPPWSAVGSGTLQMQIGRRSAAATATAQVRRGQRSAADLLLSL